MKLKNIHYLFFILLFIGSFSAKADYKSELIEACKRYQQDIKMDHINGCKLYIDGFIDSAVLSENAAILTNKQIVNNQQKSDFIKRVYQTRLVNGSKYDKQVSYQFCIPQEFQRKTIASEVALSLNIEDLKNKEFKQVVLETLMTKFPCR